MLPEQMNKVIKGEYLKMKLLISYLNKIENIFCFKIIFRTPAIFRGFPIL